MTKRGEVLVTIRLPVDGSGAAGEADPAYLPFVTGHARLYFPPRASREQCIEVLDLLHEEVISRLDAMKHERPR